MKTYQATDFKGRYFAHRGLHDIARGIPENSLPAFRAAVAKGYGVELDVQLSSDGRVVVFHDDTLDRVCGVRSRVISHPLAELQQMRLLGTDETIPLFSDVLDILRQGSGPLIVELKTGPRNQELCEKTLSFLRNYPGVFCIESFDPRIVLWFRKHAPEIFRGQLAQPYEGYAGLLPAPVAFLLAGCRLSFLNKPDFIAYRIGRRPRRVLRKRSRGVLLFGWTSKDAEHDAADNDAVIFEACTPPVKYA